MTKLKIINDFIYLFYYKWFYEENGILSSREDGTEENEDKLD